jgi:hypothetical protein
MGSVIAAIGATPCFVLLDPNTIPKGLDAFTSEPAWIGYWVFNILTLWMPVLTLVPRLLAIVKHAETRPLLTAYWAMIVGYTTSARHNRLRRHILLPMFVCRPGADDRGDSAVFDYSRHRHSDVISTAECRVLRPPAIPS